MAAPERDARIDRLADEIQKRRLAAPAILLLDSHRPFRPLAAHATTFISPILRLMLGTRPAGLATELLDSDEGVDQLITRLQAGDASGTRDA